MVQEITTFGDVEIEKHNFNAINVLPFRRCRY